MKNITVEWRHLDKDGQTCDRCAETGKTIAPMVQQLNEECGPKGVTIHHLETMLDAEEIAQSNLILINGIPLEDILPQTTAGKSSCCSCSELTGQAECCRTIINNTTVYEAIPAKLIRKAVCLVAQCCEK